MTDLPTPKIKLRLTCLAAGKAPLVGLTNGKAVEGDQITAGLSSRATEWVSQTWGRMDGAADAFGTGASPTGHVPGDLLMFEGTDDIGGRYAAGPVLVVAAEQSDAIQVVAQFGRQTPKFTGGYRPLVGGQALEIQSIEDQTGTTRTWSIVNKRLVANGTPDVDDDKIIKLKTTSGEIVEALVDASRDGRTVSDEQELMALPWLQPNYVGAGGTGFLRWMGDLNAGAAGRYDTRGQDWSNRLNGLTSYGTLTYADPQMRGRITGFADLSGSKFLDLDGLVIFLGWSVAKQEHVLTTPIVGIGDNATDIRVRNCVLQSSIPGFYEMMAADLSQDTLRSGTSHPGNGTGQTFVWGVTTHYNCKRIEVTGNFFYRLTHGVYIAGNGITVTDNLMHHCWGDFVRFAGDDTRDTKNVVLSRNFGINWVHDGSCQHADAQQWAQSETGGYDGIEDTMNIYVLGSLGVRSGGAGIPYGDTAGGLKVTGTNTMSNSSGVQVRWFDTLTKAGLCILPPSPGGTIWIQMLPNGDEDVQPLTIRVANTGSQRIVGLNGSTTEIQLKRTCSMVKLTPSGSNWSVQYMASNVNGRLQQRQDINNYLCRGNISVLASWHGLWQGGQTAGTGVSVLDNLFASPVPGDTDGDGIVSQVDGLGNNNAPWIDIPNAAANVTCARNIARQFLNKAAGGGAVLPTAGPGYADHFAAFADGVWFPDVDEEILLAPADDGFQDMETFLERLQQSREIIAGYCVLKPTSSLVGNGPVATDIEGGAVNWRTMQLAA